MSRAARRPRGAHGPALLAVATLLASASRGEADAARGERVFQRCYACHSVVAGEDQLPGPNLRCVLGRAAGALPGFEFSRAMVEAGGPGGLTWTRPALDRFVEDPRRVVPGTSMGMPGLPGPGDRQDLIDYLESRAKGCGG